MSAACVFCRIAQGEEKANVIRRTDQLTAFHDQNPQAPVHVLIIPNRHIPSANHVEASDTAWVAEMFLLAQQLAEELGVADSGYRLVLNTGPDGGQSVHHVHLHLLGGRRLRWPPG